MAAMRAILHGIFFSHCFLSFFITLFFLTNHSPLLYVFTANRSKMFEPHFVIPAILASVRAGWVQFNGTVHFFFPGRGMEADFCLQNFSVELAALMAPTNPRGSRSLKVFANDVDHLLLDHSSTAAIMALTGGSSCLPFPHPKSPAFSVVIEAKIDMMVHKVPELQRVLEHTLAQRYDLMARRDLLFQVRCLNTF